jgi:DNA-binding NarL/FixJ family response regulator
MVESEVTQTSRMCQADKRYICILDIRLPEMEGNELARHLHAQLEKAEPLLITETGYR